MRSAALMLCLLVPSLVQAATSTVTPADNLPAAIGRLQPGDTLVLKAGRYTQVLHSLLGTRWPQGTPTQPITIAGAPGEPVVLQVPAGAGTQDIIYVQNGAWLTFENLILDASNLPMTAGVSSNGFRVSESVGIRFQNSTVRGGNRYFMCALIHGTQLAIVGNRLQGCAYGVYTSGSNNLVESNDISDTAGYGVHQYQGTPASGQAPPSQDNNVIRNNCIHEFSQVAGIVQTGGGVVTAGGSNNQVYGNHIYNGSHGLGIQIYGTARNAQVYNNVIEEVGGPCIDNQNGNPGAQIHDNVCRKTGQGIVNNGRDAVLAQNQMDAGALGGTALRCGVGAGGRRYPAPTHLRAGPR